MAFFKEINAAGVVTGILSGDILPEDNDNYSYVEIEESEHTNLKAEMAASVKASPEYQITTLKAQLSAADYKITKCMEYFLVGLDLPYDVETLHAERQALRDQINALEIEA